MNMYTLEHCKTRVQLLDETSLKAAKEYQRMNRHEGEVVNKIMVSVVVFLHLQLLCNK